MTERRLPRNPMSRGQWAAQIAAMDDARRVARARREPITVERIVEISFHIVEAEGFDALTMRRVAALLHTGPASLYAHVRNKAELDDLLIGELCTHIVLPAPDPAQWQAQFIDVCRQLRDQFLRYPGISRAALAAVPNSLDALRISEGLLSILLVGGIEPQPAAWTIDAAFLYVSAYTLEDSLRRQLETQIDGQEIDRAEIIARFQMLPPNRFSNTVAYAEALTSGEHHARFDFTLDLMLSGLHTNRPAARH